MIVDCIADLHGHYPQLEGGDLLIVAGDLTAKDEESQYVEFEEWFEKQDYTRKIVIGGNHDNFLVKYGHNLFLSTEKNEDQYLCDSGIEFEGLKIWGSPWTLKFPGMNPKCMAFTCDTEEELSKKWEMIPSDTDILVTHGPPYTIKDGKNPHQNLGSTSLLKRIGKPTNIPIKLHVFGHIHEGYGIQDMKWLKLKNGFQGGIHINASHVNKYYQPVNEPVRVIL